MSGGAKRSAWPYWVFLAVFAVGALGSYASIRYENRIIAEQDQHIDRDTGRWKADYDWQAQSRISSVLLTSRRAALFAVMACSTLCAGYSLVRARERWWFGLVAVAFAALALVLLAVFALAGIGGGMIGAVRAAASALGA